MAGDSGHLATFSVLAVAGDPTTRNPAGHALSQAVAAACARTAGTVVGDAVARYDEDWNPRAFGDNFAQRGTPVALLETGGLTRTQPRTTRRGLVFLALVSGLQQLAQSSKDMIAPPDYLRLPVNRRGIFADVLLRGGKVRTPSGDTVRADLAFDVEQPGDDLEECVRRDSNRGRSLHRGGHG